MSLSLLSLSDYIQVVESFVRIIGYLCMHEVYKYIHMYVHCSSSNLPLTCGHVTFTYNFTATYVRFQCELCT